MGLHKLLVAFLAIVGTLCLVQLAAAQNGCTNPPCAPNTVPCAHCTGTWEDDEFSIVYEVSSEPNPSEPGEYEVAGTATWHPTPECTFTYDISGTIEQTSGTPGQSSGITELHWTMADRNETCENNGDPFPSLTWWFNGTMTNNSCDRASGTWLEEETEDTGNMTMTKPPDYPNGSPRETSTATGWASGENQPTVQKFKGTIQDGQRGWSFAGRQVYEVANPPNPDPPNSAPNPPNFDDCWFLGSDYPPYGLSSGGWFVGLTDTGEYFSDEHGNQYSTDGIGYILTSEVVDYYRNTSPPRAPCAAEAGQDMYLYEEFYSPSQFGTRRYKQNILRYEIGLTTVKATRDYGQPTGASREINWGITTSSPLPPATQGALYFLNPPLEGYLYPLSPITWTIDSGSLPSGLALDPDTGNIFGTPTGTGISFFIVRANASGQYSSKYFTLTVKPTSLPGQVTSD